MIRPILLCLLAAAPLSAQLTFSVVTESAEFPIASQAQLASAAVEDTQDTLVRVRNTGRSNTTVTTLSIAGSGFSLANLPVLPSTLAPNAWLDFTIRFQPSVAAAYSAVLRTDGLSVFVLGTGVSVAKVYVEENGSRRPLDPAAGLDFGTVERGGQASRRLVLVNDTAQPLTATLGIAGTGFQFAPGVPSVSALNAQTSTYFDVVLAPATAGPQQGELRIDTRRFALRGSAVEPPLPRPIVTLDFQGVSPSSGRQPVASVRFDPAPRTSGTGTLKLEFHPSVAASDDQAILFLTTGLRAIDFSVIEGVADAQFGAVTTIPLQTGTTAGTIVLTAVLGDYAETASVEIAPQTVAIDAVQMAQTATGIEVKVSGYDNTRTLSAASFTFLQSNGAALAPGAIQQDLTAIFRDYFANSTAGGSFQLKLSFPVTGNASMIDSVRVVMTNAAGQTSWPAAQ